MTRNRLIVVVAALALIPIVAIGWWLFSPYFIDEEVNEEFPFSAQATVPDNMSQDQVEDAMSAMAMVDAPMEEQMADEMRQATIVKSGEFAGIDRIHQGSGQATIYQLDDGSYVLRLENLDVTNGPDLHVLLARHENARSGALLDEGYIDLGKLKGNIGNQNYEIPAGTDIDGSMSVVIYCQPFHVVFATAPLADAG